MRGGILVIETLRDLYVHELAKARCDMESKLARELEVSIKGRMNLVRQRFDNSRRDFKEYDAELNSLCNYELFLLTVEGRLLPGFSWDDAATLYVELLEHHEKAERLWARIAVDAGSERAYYFKMIKGYYSERMEKFWNRYWTLTWYNEYVMSVSHDVLRAASSFDLNTRSWAEDQVLDLCESMRTFRLPS